MLLRAWRNVRSNPRRRSSPGPIAPRRSSCRATRPSQIKYAPCSVRRVCKRHMQRLAVRHRPSIRCYAGVCRHAVAARRSRRLLRPRLRSDPRRAALHPRPHRREGSRLPLGNFPRAEGKGIRNSANIEPVGLCSTHGTRRRRNRLRGPMMAPDDPPSFVVRTEAQKATWDNGFRLERGIENGGWLRYGSTTANREIWLAGVEALSTWPGCAPCWPSRPSAASMAQTRSRARSAISCRVAPMTRPPSARRSECTGQSRTRCIGAGRHFP